MSFSVMRPGKFLYIITAATVGLVVLLSITSLARTGLPTADVVARKEANRPIINVSDFNPGDVRIVLLNNRRVVVWRRSEADQALATRQNDSQDWRHQNSKVLGKAGTIFAKDSNLTLGNEWFFALAEFSNPFKYLFLRAGDFEGFFEGRYAAHYDLAGRIRKGGMGKNLTVIEAEYVDGKKGIRLYLEGKP